MTIKNQEVIDKSVLEFSIFCIESVAERLQTSGNIVYKLLTEQSNILDSYIIPCYDALHTQGKDYIVNDILAFMHEKEVRL